DGEPCGTCESCERIWAGRASLDVVEIDAASHRGVEDARELRERALYAPSTERRFKVYIIDEAHMLTREAWNALLKVLEEPPPRVIFVFATTDPAKILQSAAPILSRCQRFDFRRISASEILKRLREIAASEKVEVEDAALLALARRADGALRDAISALDQVLAFTGDRVAHVDVRTVLGLVEEDLYFELFEILADRRARDVFPYVQKVVEGGYDLLEFYRGLTEGLRMLLRASLGGFGPEDALPEEAAAGYGALAQRFHAGDLLRMLSALTELDTDGRFRKSEQPRVLLEALLVKFAWLDRTVDLETILERGGAASADPSAPNLARPVAPPGTTPTGATQVSPPATPSGGSTLPEARVAWARMVAEGKPLKPGQKFALRAVEVVSFSPDGEIGVRARRQEPAWELLSDARFRRVAERELTSLLGRPVRMALLEDESPAPSGADARPEARARLPHGEPELRDAIAEWDLEITQ
ncbi:MAG: DNA polymerase III subunit gamma/tau, partial [Gemmatimonadetes bacterium]|nr:DNA polymerase III subunit gamma/tau [Gemmatimonadota bacterium]